MSDGAFIPGGFGPTKPADDSIEFICNKVKHQAELRAEKFLSVFQAVQYRKQGTGTNYLIKVHVGNNVFFHLLVFQSLPLVELKNIQLEKTFVDPLQPF